MWCAHILPVNECGVATRWASASTLDCARVDDESGMSDQSKERPLALLSRARIYGDRVVLE
eukprot:5284102-Prymnesium_polylepis.2